MFVISEKGGGRDIIRVYEIALFSKLIQQP